MGLGNAGLVLQGPESRAQVARVGWGLRGYIGVI